MKRREFLLSSGAVLAIASCTPKPTPAADPFPAAFAPVRNVLKKQIADMTIPGSVFLIAHNLKDVGDKDEVIVSADGVTTVGGSAPMQRDTIFRIASMTKAVTAAAVMMLVEEGKLTLDENAERLLPELANRKVLKTISSPIDDTVPASHPITVREIMNFTFGYGINFDPSLPINKAGAERQLTLAEPTPMTPHAPDEWMRLFGELPLMYQPGERWLYNVGSLLQGVLVRRASGQDFDTFVSERITGPLGMKDTAFFVAPDKLNRFAGCANFTDPATKKQTRMDKDGAESAYATRPIFPSGAGGLCSTVDDYLAFQRMLLADGELGGKKLLSPESVRLMTTNQLTDEQRKVSDKSLTPGMFDAAGWGYGMGVQIAANPDTDIPGAYGWDGGFGSSWFTDPNRKIISIVMTQSPDFLFNGGLAAYRSAVYKATAAS
ncbi:MAG TPA: serine hydrolase domain-containing protein [Hyphomonadaceae bacterium]|nr:serine hydrolase domain-containing protein [Hyphomonadaceae bacterium]